MAYIIPITLDKTRVTRITGNRFPRQLPFILGQVKDRWGVGGWVGKTIYKDVNQNTPNPTSSQPEKFSAIGEDGKNNNKRASDQECCRNLKSSHG